MGIFRIQKNTYEKKYNDRYGIFYYKESTNSRLKTRLWEIEIELSYLIKGFDHNKIYSMMKKNY